MTPREAIAHFHQRIAVGDDVRQMEPRQLEGGRQRVGERLFRELPRHDEMFDQRHMGRLRVGGRLRQRLRRHDAGTFEHGAKRLIHVVAQTDPRYTREENPPYVRRR